MNFFCLFYFKVLFTYTYMPRLIVLPELEDINCFYNEDQNRSENDERICVIPNPSIFATCSY